MINFTARFLKQADPVGELEKLPKVNRHKIHTAYALTLASKKEMDWILDPNFNLTPDVPRTRMIVPLAQVVTDQETAGIDKIMVYLTDPDLIHKVTPPLVVLLPDGKYMIEDGNHRVLAAKLLGETKFLMLVVKYEACINKTASKTARPFSPKEKDLLEQAKGGDMSAFVKLYRDKIIIRKKPGKHTTPCWQWAAAGDADGYGKIKFEGTTTAPHRLVWVLLNGPIGIGEDGKKMEVDHTCQTPSCFNPEHLQLITSTRNKQLIKERRDAKKLQQQEAEEPVEV